MCGASSNTHLGLNVLRSEFKVILALHLDVISFRFTHWFQHWLAEQRL